LRAWRFHLAAYSPLDTTGSHTYGGRWNAPGVPVIYTTPTYAGGLPEFLAHASEPRRPPREHVATLLEVPEDAGVAGLEPPFPPGWDHPSDHRVARVLTQPWLSDQTDLCLLVPSVPGSPVEQNLIINAQHPRFGDVEIREQIDPVFDPRIWG
jgi:RES domain-containing protein